MTFWNMRNTTQKQKIRILMIYDSASPGQKLLEGDKRSGVQQNNYI